jgi:hypothetical protein
MKRIVTLSAVLVFGGLGLATAQAGHSNNGSSHSSQHSSNKQTSSSSNSSKSKVYMGGSSSGPKGTPENPFCKDHSDHCEHKDCHDPKYPVIDPGKGDGKTGNTTVITDPIYPWAHPDVRDHRTGSTGGTTTSGNFVWAGDHWERAKATGSATNIPPLSGGNGQGGVTVTGTTGTNVSGFHGGGGASNVRDHRTGSANGGVTVTNTPGSTRNNDVVGVGGSPIDTAVQGVVDFFSFDVGSVPQTGVRDHRTTDTSNFGSNVRDHRTTDTSNFSSGGGRGGK